MLLSNSRLFWKNENIDRSRKGRPGSSEVWIWFSKFIWNKYRDALPHCEGHGAPRTQKIRGNESGIQATTWCNYNGEGGASGATATGGGAWVCAPEEMSPNITGNVSPCICRPA